MQHKSVAFIRAPLGGPISVGPFQEGRFLEGPFSERLISRGSISGRGATTPREDVRAHPRRVDVFRSRFSEGRIRASCCRNVHMGPGVIRFGTPQG